MQLKLDDCNTSLPVWVPLYIPRVVFATLTTRRGGHIIWKISRIPEFESSSKCGFSASSCHRAPAAIFTLRRLGKYSICELQFVHMGVYEPHKAQDRNPTTMKRCSLPIAVCLRPALCGIEPLGDARGCLTLQQGRQKHRDGSYGSVNSLKDQNKRVETLPSGQPPNIPKACPHIF